MSYLLKEKTIDTMIEDLDIEGLLIAASAKKGNYKGREKIKIDKLAAQEIFLDYSVKRINSTDASEKLGISKSTFLRRYREYENARQ